MKSILLLTLPVVVMLISGCSKREQSVDLLSLELNNLQHQKFSFTELTANKAAAIIFLQPECPFCISYAKTLRHLDSILTNQGILFIGVVAGKNYPENDIAAYCQNNQLHFPVLLDPDFTLQKKLNAITTPEVFLVSNTGEVLYRGLIDNWAYEIGKVRPVVTEHYLTDAVNAWLAHKPITPDSTKAIGCYIE